MSSILQGTTPVLKIKLPDEFDASSIQEIELVFKSSDKTTKYARDVELTDNVISYHFTQEETLELSHSTNLRWQLRLKLLDGNVVGTVINRIAVSDLISEDIL